MAYLDTDLGAGTLFQAVLAACVAVAVLVGEQAMAASPRDEDLPLKLVATWTLPEQDLDAADGPPATHRLRLEMVVMRASGWSPVRILESTKEAVRILAQCGIRTTSVQLHEYDGPARYRYLATPVSRDLARRVRLARPVVFFVADTRNRPAFDAEAIGRANSRSRPEMTDTVWITAATRDLPNVIAHELVHVLADAGEHSELPGNLMREETAAESTALTIPQCRRIAETGAANGLLQPIER